MKVTLKPSLSGRWKMVEGRNEGQSIIAIVTFASRGLHKHGEVHRFGRYELGSDCSSPAMKPQPNPYYNFDGKDEPLSPGERLPSLPRLNLDPSSVEFLERLPNGLHEGATSGVFRVNITTMGERVLKVVSRVRLTQVTMSRAVN